MWGRGDDKMRGTYRVISLAIRSAVCVMGEGYRTKYQNDLNIKSVYIIQLTIMVLFKPGLTNVYLTCVYWERNCPMFK